MGLLLIGCMGGWRNVEWVGCGGTVGFGRGASGSGLGGGLLWCLVVVVRAGGGMSVCFSVVERCGR